MRALFIGGTGTISTEITKLALQRGWDLTLLNRGNRPDRVPQGAKTLAADIQDEGTVTQLLAGQRFDVVCDFIVFSPQQLERDIRLFSGLTSQYIFISSASAYQKPPNHWLIDEATPLANPHWGYSRDKIACEERLLEAYRQEGFPMTIVRPSHTYDKSVPVPIHGEKGCWQVLKRMLEGKPVLVQGDGTSLWTMTHSRDFAQAFLGLMGNPKAMGEAVQITSDEQLTWNQVLQGVGTALGVQPIPYHVSSDFLIACQPALEGPLLGDKSHSVVFDNAKIKRLCPGYNATIRFDQGVREAIAHLLANPALQVEDPAFDAWCDRVIAAHEAGKAAFNA